MSVDSCSAGLRGEILSARLEERLEDCGRIVEVIMNNVDEEAVFHQVGYQSPGRRLRFVQLRPLLTKLKSLVL